MSPWSLLRVFAKKDERYYIGVRPKEYKGKNRTVVVSVTDPKEIINMIELIDKFLGIDFCWTRTRIADVRTSIDLFIHTKTEIDKTLIKLLLKA